MEVGPTMTWEGHCNDMGQFTLQWRGPLSVNNLTVGDYFVAGFCN